MRCNIKHLLNGIFISHKSRRVNSKFPCSSLKYLEFLKYIFCWTWVCWPLLCLCCPFCIFCLDSNPESCRSRQAGYRLSHPSPSNLATNLPKLSHPTPYNLATHLPSQKLPKILSIYLQGTLFFFTKEMRMSPKAYRWEWPEPTCSRWAYSWQPAS